jgi:hypothetical protein
MYDDLLLGDSLAVLAAGVIEFHLLVHKHKRHPFQPLYHNRLELSKYLTGMHGRWHEGERSGNLQSSQGGS